MPVRVLVTRGVEASYGELLPLLEAEGYRVHFAELAEAERYLAMTPPALALLGLHRLDPETRPRCIRICQRAKALMVPLMLLVEESDGDGLPDGPAASLVSPPSPDCAMAAIRTLVHNPEARILAAGSISLRLDERSVLGSDGVHSLPPKEFELLRTLMRYPGRVLTRRFLMHEVWKTSYLGDTRTLDVHVHLVRRKIEPDPRNPRYVKTVRGVGYRFDAGQPGRGGG